MFLEDAADDTISMIIKRITQICSLKECMVIVGTAKQTMAKKTGAGSIIWK